MNFGTLVGSLVPWCQVKSNLVAEERSQILKRFPGYKKAPAPKTPPALVETSWEGLSSPILLFHPEISLIAQKSNIYVYVCMCLHLILYIQNY